MKNLKRLRAISKVTLRSILKHNPNTALLIGNGFNYSFYSSTVVSWDELVADLWNEVHQDKTITGKYVKNKSISLTETVDVSEKDFDDIRKIVVKELSKPFIKNGEAHKFLEYLENNNIPIITTNYDKNIAQEMDLSLFGSCEEEDEFDLSRFKWEKYYSTNELPSNCVLNKFAVWNAHGTVDNPRSICLSLRDYIECIDHANEKLQNIYSPFYIEYKSSKESFIKTWLNVLFNKNICILGLTLNENEIFLRHMLMLRYKYMKNHLGSAERFKGWYLYVDNADMSASKRFFLKSVNIQPIKCRNYNRIYRSF